MAYVKMEMPEASEFEVYMDIDGAVEEDEDSMPGDSEVQSVPLTQGETAVHLPWPLDKGAAGTGQSGLSEINSTPRVSSSSVHSVQQPDSDNEEIDIDTPYDGRLMGQTLVKSEHAGQPSLLSRILNFAAVQGTQINVVRDTVFAQKKSSVARKSTTQKKQLAPAAGKKTAFTSNKISKNVALKSTTAVQSKFKSVSNFNVAKIKKPTFNQSKPSASSTASKPKASETKTNNLLQVKFGPKKSTTQLMSRPVHHGKASIFSNMSRNMFSKNKPSVTTPSPSSKLRLPVTLPSDFQPSNKMFMYNEKSGDKIACPECSVWIAQWCLRSHMKTVHNMSLKMCKKCRVTFTDMNLFSEHYARHLQEEEDFNAGIITSPSTVNSPKQIPLKSPVVRPVIQHSAEGKSYGFEGQSVVRQSQNNPDTKKRKLFHTPADANLAKLRRLSKTSLSSKLAVPVQLRLPPKPRKPGGLFKKGLSPVSVNTLSQSPTSTRSDNSPDRGNSWTSFHSESSGDSSDTTELVLPKLPPKPRKPSLSPRKRLVSYHNKLEQTRRPAFARYMVNQKAAFRRGSTGNQSANSHVLPAPKELHSYKSSSDHSEIYQRKAVVSLVSLETASQPYDCKICLAAFHLALACPRSFRQQTQRTNVVCDSSSATFSHTHQLKTHKVAVKEDESDSMDGSQNKSNYFGRESHDSSPARSEKHTGVFECSVCKQTFQFRSYFLRHLPYHSFQYCCGVCKKAFDEKVDLLDHLQIMHDGRLTLRCKYCEKKFEDMKEYEIHVHSHKNGTVVPCNVCNKKFGNSRQMHLHSKVAHGISQGTFAAPKSYGYVKPIVTKFLSCRVCGKVFHKKQGLASHYKLCHDMSMSAAMTVPSKKFAANVLKKSQGHHAETKSKTVLPDANKDSEQEISVTTHNRNSRRCRICGAFFRERKKLVSHLRSVHGLEMSGSTSVALKCNICGKFVYTLQGMKTHYRLRHKKSVPKSFTGTEPTVCIRCNKVFSEPRTLQRHQQLFHKSLRLGNTISKPNYGTDTMIQNLETGDADCKDDQPASQKSQHKKAWQCQFCRKSFMKFKTMRMHIRIEHPEKFVDQRHGTRKCTKCKKTFGSKALLHAHIKVCSLRRGVYKQRRFPGHFPCALCSKKFCWKRNLVRHLQLNHHLSKEEISYNLTPIKPATVLQQTNPAERKLHLCRVCNIGFPKQLSYSRHVNRTHGGKTDFFQCRIRNCQRTLSCTKALVKHIRTIHPGTPPFRCHGCQTGFRCSRLLLQHKCVSFENSEASFSQEEDTEHAQDNPSHKECRYRCTACGLGFHIAREWTRHMQEHTELMEEDASNVSATERVQLNIFDVMSTDSVYTCHLCYKIFTDESALALHICENSVQTTLPAITPLTKKGKGKNKAKSKQEPVRCTVCLKLFSPFSIKRHMMNIHSLPMRVCKTCNIVFTDLHRYRKHCESHKQQNEATEGDAGTVSADDSGDDSVTFFICQTCGGLFRGADSLALHECTGEPASDLALAGDTSFTDSPATDIMTSLHNETVLTVASGDAHGFINKVEPMESLGTGSCISGEPQSWSESMGEIEGLPLAVCSKYSETSGTSESLQGVEIDHAPADVLSWSNDPAQGLNIVNTDQFTSSADGAKGSVGTLDQSAVVSEVVQTSSGKTTEEMVNPSEKQVEQNSGAEPDHQHVGATDAHIECVDSDRLKSVTEVERFTSASEKLQLHSSSSKDEVESFAIVMPMPADLEDIHVDALESEHNQITVVKDVTGCAEVEPKHMSSSQTDDLATGTVQSSMNFTEPEEKGSAVNELGQQNDELISIEADHLLNHFESGGPIVDKGDLDNQLFFLAESGHSSKPSQDLFSDSGHKPEEDLLGKNAAVQELGRDEFVETEEKQIDDIAELEDILLGENNAESEDGLLRDKDTELEEELLRENTRNPSLEPLGENTAWPEKDLLGEDIPEPEKELQGIFEPENKQLGESVGQLQVREGLLGEKDAEPENEPLGAAETEEKL